MALTHGGCPKNPLSIPLSRSPSPGGAAHLLSCSPSFILHCHSGGAPCSAPPTLPPGKKVGRPTPPSGSLPGQPARPSGEGGLEMANTGAHSFLQHRRPALPAKLNRGELPARAPGPLRPGPSRLPGLRSASSAAHSGPGRRPCLLGPPLPQGPRVRVHNSGILVTRRYCGASPQPPPHNQVSRLVGDVAVPAAPPAPTILLSLS